MQSKWRIAVRVDDVRRAIVMRTVCIRGPCRAAMRVALVEAT